MLTHPAAIVNDRKESAEVGCDDGYFLQGFWTKFSVLLHPRLVRLQWDNFTHCEHRLIYILENCFWVSFGVFHSIEEVQYTGFIRSSKLESRQSGDL